ncbi:MAG: ATP-dependent carboxylate-amine ligase domain protein ATP-grasp [Anaerocolumna sp.]|nr:ATP-dependent carboxylate-amine ligase domain protein ATP-grasp [Anaerocolumna sp.]
MRKTVLVIIAKGGGHYPLKQLTEYLFAAGHKIVFAKNKNDNLNEFDKYAEDIIDVDVYNIDSLLTEVTEYKERNRVDAIVTVNEYVVEQTAILCRVLGLKGLDVGAAKRCRNKYLTRFCLSKNGFEQPKFGLVRKPEDLHEMADKLGYPFIVKPMNFAGSCAVTKVEDETALSKIIKNLDNIKKNAPSNEHFIDSIKDYWLAEEYLRGAEITVECVADKGKPYIIAIHDKMVLNDYDDFLEQYAVTPSPRLTEDTQLKIVEQSKEILKALGFDNGIAHIEYRVDGDKLGLLEVNARIGGVLIAASAYNSTKVNLSECLVKISLEEEIVINIKERIPTAFCTAFTGVGYVKSIRGIEEARRMDGLVYMDQWIKTGDKIDNKMDGYGIVLMYQGKDSNEAYKRASTAVATIAYEME